MNIKALNQPLGMGISYAPSHKQWIISAISAAGALASSLFGGAKASAAANAAERRQRKQEARDDAWYNKRYNEDYVDTAAGQNLVRRAKDYAKEQWRKAAGAQAVSGGTASAAQMAKDAGNKMVGDTIANIAATDQARKSNADVMHQRAQQQYAQMDMNREMQRAQNITTAAQNASNAIMQAGSALDGATSLTGGDNKGTEIPKTTEQIDTDMGVKPNISSDVFGGDGVLGKISEAATAEERRRARGVIGG